MVMESMAARIRSNPLVSGIGVGDTEHKISLFADDVIFTLSNPEDSLPVVLQELSLFGEGFQLLYLNSLHITEGTMIQNQNVYGQQSQSTVVTIVSHEPPVRDYLPWSIYNTISMNVCCLGLIALVYSVKARDQKLVGDKHGASNYGLTARNLNIAATVVSIILFIILIALYIAGIIVAFSVPGGN
ncbi:uncharacterized protein WCC33_008026 [Rhinophrynus dorsalis]